MPREIQSASPVDESVLANVRKAIADKLALAGAAALTSGMATVVAYSLLAIASPSSFSDAALTQFLSNLSANWLSQIVWNLRGRMEKRVLNPAEEQETLRQLSGDVVPQLSDGDLSKVLARLHMIETSLQAAEAAQVDVGALTREMLQVGIATKEDISAAVARIRPSQSAQAQINTAINSTIITFVGDGNFITIGETEAQKGEHAILEDIKIHQAQLVARHAPLDLRGLDIVAQASAAGGSLDFRLESVYTPLFTRRLDNGRPHESGSIGGKRVVVEPQDSVDSPQQPDRVPIVEALNEAPRAVILGKGGSGKSTVLKHVVLGLCGEAAEFKREWRHGSLLPIWVTLRDFADYAHGRSVGPRENAEQREAWAGFTRLLQDNPAEALIDYVIADLMRSEDKRRQALPALARNLETWLKERGGVFLMDGLDEVPAAQLFLMRRAIAGLAERFPRCRFIVACRPYSYRDAQKADTDRALKIAAGGKPFAELDVLPLDGPQIDFFVRHWYVQLADLIPDLSLETANRRSGELVAQIKQDERLRVLAETPLLLTLIGSLHGLGNRRLPNERWELLKQVVDLLLVSWQRRKPRSEIPPEFDSAEVRIHKALDAKRGEALLTRLYQLAHDVHAGATALDPSAASDITEWQLMAALRDVLPPDIYVSDLELAQYLRDRAGLILDEGGKDNKEHVYRFPHRMFQEYLCACHVRESYFEVAPRIDSEFDRWQEVYALLALMSETATFTKTCVQELFLHPPASTADWRRAELAASIWADFPPLRLETVLRNARHPVTQHIEQIRGWLQARMSDFELASPPERARAGDALARLGDPRFDAEHWFLPKGDWLGFTRIEADPEFRIGTRECDFKRVMRVVGGDKNSDQDEIGDAPTPTRGFYIGRYPVTVAQFRAFVNSNPSKTRYDDALREPDNRPVRWVNWRDAMEYCVWLDTQLKSEAAPAPLRDLLRSGQWRVTLPSELEWEKAARGGLRDTIFSWGDDANPAMANYADTRIGTTSSVGCFPVNGYGLNDMIGNEWEWTRGEHKSYPFDVATDLKNPDLTSGKSRVVRGGAFLSLRGGARCAYRYFDRPEYRGDGYGFRVVLSPS